MDIPLGRNRPENYQRPLKITHKIVSIISMSNYYFNKINMF